MTYHTQAIGLLCAMLVISALALPFGLYMLAQGFSQSRGERLGADSRTEAIMLGLAFLLCGAGIAYMTLMAVGLVPSISTPHVSIAHASFLAFVAVPREQAQAYLQRVEHDLAELRKVDVPESALYEWLNDLSKGAYEALTEAYMEQGNVGDDAALTALQWHFLADENGALTYSGRMLAAYALHRARTRYMLDAISI